MSQRFEMISVSMFRMTRCWQQLAGQEMEKYGLKGGCALYLSILLHREEGVTAAWLAAQCGRDKADVSRAITAMEQQGMVERSEEQRYRAVIRLTPKGRQVAEEIEQTAEAVILQAGEGLSEEQKAVFRQAFTLISENMSRICRDGINQVNQEQKI